MKLNREQITELFGSTPEDQDGKKLVGMERRYPKEGESYFSDTYQKWCKAHSNFEYKTYPVAIFETTHREDGTPMDIDPLPVVEGYRVEYVRGEDMPNDGQCSKVFYYDEIGGDWLGSIVENVGRDRQHYARIFKIAQPTTLADLVGEDGQKVVWVISEYRIGDKFHTGFSASVEHKDGKLTGIDGECVNEHIDCGTRWSNSPFTAYEDANEFTE